MSAKPEKRNRMRMEIIGYWPIFLASVVYTAIYVSRIDGDLDQMIITFLNRNMAGLVGDVFVLVIWLGMSPLFASLPFLVFVKSNTALLRTAIVLIGLSSVFEPTINYVSNLRSSGDGLDLSTIMVNGLTIIVGGLILLAVVVLLRFFFRLLKGAKANA